MKKADQIIISHRPAKTPCLDCKTRHTGCHAECRIYADWRRATTDYNEAKRRIKQREDTLSEYKKSASKHLKSKLGIKDWK